MFVNSVETLPGADVAARMPPLVWATRVEGATLGAAPVCSPVCTASCAASGIAAMQESERRGKLKVMRCS